MPTLKFHISTRVSNGQAEVLARFYHGAFSQRAKTRIPAPISAWDDKAGQLIVPKKISPESVAIRETQRRLDALTDAVYEAWWRDKYDAREGWLQKIIDEYVYHDHFDAPKTIRDVYEEYAVAKNLDETTRKKYNVMLAALDRFAKNRKLYVDEIRVHDIDAFCAFFRKENLKDKKGKKHVVNRSQNTITGKLKCWRALQNFAVLRGYAKTSPFAQFSIPAEVYGTPIFLTTEERNKLAAFDDLSPVLRVQRDIFIFQCHVGCRVSDLLSLTKDNITEDGFLQYIPQKQRRSVPQTVRVPLSPTAKEILERYAGGVRLLPFIHPNYYNDAIHEVMRAAGLDRIVMVQNPVTMQPEYKPLWEVTTSHTARKTFIEAMFRETKSERITSAFTGHAVGSRAFSRYTDVDDDMKMEILSKIEN